MPRSAAGGWECGSDAGWCPWWIYLLSSSAVMQYSFCAADPLRVVPNLDKMVHAPVFRGNDVERQCTLSLPTPAFEDHMGLEQSSSLF